jgi:hypothetical protein
MTRTMLVGTVLVCALAATGCGKKMSEKLGEKIMEKAIEHNSGGNAKVDISDKGMTIKTKDGEFVAGQAGAVKLPADFPSDVLVYKGSKPVVSMKTGNGLMIHLETGDSVEKVIETYGKEMPSQGWEQETAMNSAEQSMFVFKKEKRQTAVVVTKSDNVTRIMLTVSNEGK